jgi:hypothetical protein
MKLPGGEDAIVDMAKLRDYCLSSTHLVGPHKARVFQSALGLTAADAMHLQAALKSAARGQEAVVGISDIYGTRYIIDFELQWTEKVAIIRSSWIIRTSETAPRFLTCYIL